MRVTAQVYSAAGFYGPELSFDIAMLAEIGECLVEAIEKLPDTLEGEHVIDWSRVSITIDRTHPV